jgi:hypothetical protein
MDGGGCCAAGEFPVCHAFARACGDCAPLGWPAGAVGRPKRGSSSRPSGNSLDDYQQLGHAHDIGIPGKPFFLDAEWCDATPPPEGDYTRWSVRQRPSGAPECSFVVFLTGSTAKSGAYAIPSTEDLKLAVLFAISDEVRRLLREGQVPSHDHPVMVTTGTSSAAETERTHQPEAGSYTSAFAHGGPALR